MWAASLPALDERLDLGTGRTGTVLLLVSLGVLVSMQGAGRLADRWSSRRVCLISGPIAALVLLGPALAGSYGVLLACAFVFGLGLGVLELAMNAHAVEVELVYERPIMSSFHGMWSLGGAAGGLLTSAALRGGLGVGTLLTITAIAGAVLFLLPGPLLLHDRTSPKPVEAKSAERRSVGRAAVLLLGAVVFAGAIAEGAAMDWAAIHARRVLEVDPDLAPLAFTVFSTAMTVMRFLGDRIRGRLGATRTLRLAGSLAASGYALVLIAPLTSGASMALAWAGWALVGTGLATVVPVAFSSVGASQEAAGRALAMITTFLYCGLLAGPAVIGHLADLTSLPAALALPGILAVFVALAGPRAISALLPTRPHQTPVPTPTT
ncbi:MFS transporter [Actinomadura barringtoniae]|uniref:MFS transporter n=2 Tax=Actinomadura barringtoniae TaxID=1427535 RepID=A0A939T479_9ACTN|nr:MFS transporter [Actinomadura barringtoniae]